MKVKENPKLGTLKRELKKIFFCKQDQIHAWNDHCSSIQNQISGF